MPDTIEKYGKTIVQHGKENDRIYLMNLDKDDYNNIITFINKLADKHKYSKIFAKAPEEIKDTFIDDGYIIEAILPSYYNGTGKCLFMSKFLSDNRKKHENKKEIERVINVAKLKANNYGLPTLKQNMILRKLDVKDAFEMTKVYKKVFQTYPFPIDDKDYLIQTMMENVVYYGIFDNGKLFAISSSELNINYQNAEMTDFAVLPQYRGQNYSLLLLNEMEKTMKNNGFKMLYTIARALSYGMNATFSKLGYTYSGTLINNTNISGSIESMNVWYKVI